MSSENDGDALWSPFCLEALNNTQTSEMANILPKGCKESENCRLIVGYELSPAELREYVKKFEKGGNKILDKKKSFHPIFGCNFVI